MGVLAAVAGDWGGEIPRFRQGRGVDLSCGLWIVIDLLAGPRTAGMRLGSLLEFV